MAKQPKQGETAWSQTEKINAELFAFTYGSLVVKLIKENDNLAEVNTILESMGYNIGVRLIDDFLSKTDLNCEEISDTAEVIAKVGFKVYLGITCEVVGWSDDKKEFSMIMSENPMTEYVELREDFQELTYCNLICGVIRGALEMVRYKAEVRIVRDSLKGADCTEIRVKIIEKKKDEYEPDDP